jgi:hypothetical protein
LVIEDNEVTGNTTGGGVVVSDPVCPDLDPEVSEHGGLQLDLVNVNLAPDAVGSMQCEPAAPSSASTRRISRGRPI